MSTDQEILAAVDALPVHRKARLMPLLRRRLEDYYDLQAVKRARRAGVWHRWDDVKRELDAKRTRSQSAHP